MQQDSKIIIEAPKYKMILYGISLALVVIGLLALVFLLITGQAKDILGRVTLLLIGLITLLRIGALFVYSSIRFTFEGNMLQRAAFGRPASSFDLASLTRIQPAQGSMTAATKRPDSLLFTDAKGNIFVINAYSLAALSKTGRQQLMGILEPFILKQGIVQETDKTGVQKLLSGFNPDAPIKLTADAEAFAIKTKRLFRIVKVILFVGFLPLISLVLFAVVGTIFRNITCDKLLAEGKETTAKITTLDVKRNGSNEISTLRLDLSYIVNGQTFNEELYVYSQDAKTAYEKIKAASSIQIRYLPDDPKTAKLASEFSDGTAAACKF